MPSRYLPILGWARTYDRETFSADAVAAARQAVDEPALPVLATATVSAPVASGEKKVTGSDACCRYTILVLPHSPAGTSRASSRRGTRTGTPPSGRWRTSTPPPWRS